ncbi:HD-GYP domain-containing protein [Sphingobium sufflavum]|uniref:HD-GYP domain-containing protein n=1 Tax=Sphingobium sufflavum TaxID=1129547 RepID=UPI001F2F09AF|nr:HD-GYP domain-containing protein [Sphingobium sufflavum]MCE7795308.1 HD-GYP domain-containing protein [Sphingobium sufflavum]
MIQKIRCDQIRAGMYIHGFGGSWLRHPFWSRRFLLECPEDVEKVRNSDVPYVLVDDELGIGPDQSARQDALRPTEPLRVESRRPTEAAENFGDEKRASDKQQAQKLVLRSKKVIQSAFDRARLGRAVRISDVIDVVNEINVSVARTPHALLSVTRLKTKDEYTYLHSVAVCALMINVSRHLGLDSATILDLGLAGLLHDVGKMGVPDPILNKAGRLSDEEFAIIKTHPEQGYQMLCAAPNMVESALDVCRHHHEKLDGTGYPFGIEGSKISFAARLGAICDVYDAVTSVRPYKDAWAPTEAVAAMWSWEGHFDRKLLFSFMQSIGIFPTGMLVRLRSNRLGIVLNNRRRVSRPRVLAFYSAREKQFVNPETVVIKDSLDGDQIISPEFPSEWGFKDWEAMVNHLQDGRLPPLAAGGC